MTEKRTEYIIHKTLKSERNITQSKGHYQEFIMTLMSVKCSLGDVYLLHTYLVVARMEVKFGKVWIPTEFIQKVIYDRNGEFVLDFKSFEGSKIMTHAPSAILN